MKPLITALGICAFLLAGNAAYADLHAWDGGDRTDNWSAADNWDNNIVPEGCDDITIILSGTTSIYDSSMSPTTFGLLTIGNNTSAVTLQVDNADIWFDDAHIMGNTSITGDYDVYISSTYCDGNGDMSLYQIAAATISVDTDQTLSADTLTIDADTPDASRALTKSGAGSLVVGTSTTLTGDDDSGNYTATLTLSAGTFDPAVLYLYGGNTSDRKSIFDYDAGTLTNPDSMTMQGYSSVDAEASMTLAGQLTVDAGSYATSANIDMASTTTFTAPSIAVGDDNYACTLSFTSAGTGANRSKLVTN